MKINVKGLRFQNWMYLMLFSVIILTVLWALQFLLLGHFHHSIKLNELKNAGDKIVERLNHTAFPEENELFQIEKMSDISKAIAESKFNNNLPVMLLDESGKSTWSYFTISLPQNGLTQTSAASVSQKYLDDALQKLLEKNEDSACYLNTNEEAGTTQSIYIARLKNGNEKYRYVYICNIIPPIDSTASVLKTQFIIVTVMLFLLSLIVAQLISRKMSKPIVRLTKASERLVKGELDEAFYEEGFTEIQQLASTLNYAAGELRSLDDYRREFLANVSHDLKTPLTIIKFYGEMIQDVSGDYPDKRGAHCDTIIKEADRLTDLVDELLALSKLKDMSRRETEQTKLDLSHILSDI